MVLLGFFTLALFTGSINSSRVQLLSLKNARAYANSVAEDSLPTYAIDEEEGVNLPTCFHSKMGHFDPDGFSWLVIDLGVVTQNITEIYLVHNSNTADVSDLEVFVTTYMHSVTHYGGGVKVTAGLPWDAYSLCNTATSDLHSVNSATVHCATPLHGRWLLLRRQQQPLQLCLLAIYVRKNENRCFKPVDPILNFYARANEFRLERHISLEQCRESCAGTPSCQGLAFSKRSQRHSTGLCRLFRESTTTDVNDDVENTSQLIKCEEDCQLEQNECNLGSVFPLTRMNEKDEGNEGKSPSSVSVWRIEEPKDLANAIQLQKTLYAIRLNGRIVCEAESCGDVQVVLVNREGEESICSSIDTDLVAVLDSYTIQCHSGVITSDAVAVKLVPSAKVSAVPRLQITDGYARFILTNNKQSRSLSALPSPSKEFFDFPAVERGFSKTENPKGQPKVFGLSTESSDTNRKSINSPSESSWSTIAEGESFVPFNSTELSHDILPNLSAFTKSEGVPKLTDSTISVSGNGDAFLQSVEPPVNPASNPQSDSINSSNATLIQSRNSLKSEVRPQKADHAFVSLNPLQNDAEVLPQEVKYESETAKTNATALSEANLLNAGSGSLSIANLVISIVIISVVVVVAIAAAVWFVCVRGK
uniref:Apple n=1 Tax=Echinococcus granulosus TaxID=6210 RepID=A0A068WDY5_ECHGR|nr:Apple [Echinococcus granulosus]